MKLPPAIRVLPLTILIGAVALAAANFTTIFELTSGQEPFDELSGFDRHGPALLVLAIATLAALSAAVRLRSRPATLAVVGFGVVALLIFLIRDLSVVGTEDFIEDEISFIRFAKLEPQIGFWLEAIGSVAMALGGIAFATLFHPEAVGRSGEAPETFAGDHPR